MVARLTLAMVFGLVSWGAWATPDLKIDPVVTSVIVESRAGKDWCVLESRGTMVVPTSPEKLMAVVTDYPRYPALFPKIREAKAEVVDGAVLLTQKVVVSVMGFDNVNRFTLRLVQGADAARVGVTSLVWTQAWTDGSIDSNEGGWTFEVQGSASAPLVKVTYRTKSAVPMKFFGQDAFVRAFLGGEIRAALEAVAKAALAR